MERWVARKIIVIVFISSFLLIHFSAPAQASLKIIPGKLTITMPEGFPKEAITYYIYATNIYSYGVNASAIIANAARLPNGYTQIPDLSWITVKPEKIYIPSGSTGKFEILIDVPKDQQSSQYNKKWETWVTISDDAAKHGTGGSFIQLLVSARILINTPSSNVSTINQSSYFIIGLILAIMATFAVIFYSKKSRNKQNQKL